MAWVSGWLIGFLRSAQLSVRLRHSGRREHRLPVWVRGLFPLSEACILPSCTLSRCGRGSQYKGHRHELAC